MLAQYNGDGLNEVKTVWYAGTATLKTGEVLCYDLDDTAAPTTLPAGSLTVPPTSSVQPRNLRGRQVTDPVTANLSAVAGVVSPESSGVTGPAWVSVVVPRKGDVALVYSNANATKNTTVLGAADSTRSAAAVSDSTFNLPAIAVAIETVDRSGTAGTILSRFI
jgi:hypothetical protein